MSLTDREVEKEILAKDLTAPRVTLQQIQDAIVSEQYYVFPGTTLTSCLLTLKNGYTVTGESACASPENFDEELGHKMARRQAETKIWSLEGYALRQRLHEDLGIRPFSEATIDLINQCEETPVAVLRLSLRVPLNVPQDALAEWVDRVCGEPVNLRTFK